MIKLNMPILTLLIFIGLIILWFLLTGAFKPVGKLFYKIFKDTKDTLNEEEQKNE